MSAASLVEEEGYPDRREPFHHGVLFLDEMPELGRAMLDILASPWRTVCMYRKDKFYNYISKLVHAGGRGKSMQCGYYGDP